MTAGMEHAYGKWGKKKTSAKSPEKWIANKYWQNHRKKENGYSLAANITA